MFVCLLIFYIKGDRGDVGCVDSLAHNFFKKNSTKINQFPTENPGGLQLKTQIFRYAHALKYSYISIV